MPISAFLICIAIAGEGIGAGPIECGMKKASSELAGAGSGAPAEGSVLPSVPASRPTAAAAPAPVPVPVVEVEEDVYRYEPANNGAGPFWCHGSTCLVRIGEDVLASGLETLKEFKPLNNCRWVLYRRTATGWERQQADQTGRTREPCPLAGFPDGRLFLSVNPALPRDREERQSLARPEILQFSAADPKAPFQTILPVWEGNPRFIDHSYRSFAADGPRGELVLFQNIEWNHAEWSFRDKDGKWVSGKLVWPWGAEYPVPQPIRVCYPNVALKNRAVHFCGVSDIDEPYPEWKAFKQQMPDKGGDFNGILARNWGCDFRRLWYAWSEDIASGKFRPWLELANRDKTCGFIRPGDLWIAADGAAHVVWTEQAIETRLREKFFPGAKQVYQLNYAVVSDGKVRSRRTLIETGEGISGELPNCPRFQVTPDGRLFVCYYVDGTDASGKPVSENRLIQIHGDTASPPVKIPLMHPISGSLPMMYFTATVRAGSPPSIFLDLLGQRADASQTISYARIRL